MKFSIYNFQFSRKSFTLVEVLVVIVILIIVTGITASGIFSFSKTSDLNNATEEIINILRLAQSKTLASQGASQWGVYFSTSTFPNQYILFKGDVFDSRDSSFDEVHLLPRNVEFFEINLWQGKEVVFERITGYASSTSQIGKISVIIRGEPSKIKNIYIENSGLISLSNPSVINDTDRLKDSRHVHFNYNRLIATSTEKIILTFFYDTASTTQEIIIADNLKDNQIYWTGEVNVGGEIQRLEIHTHWLNDPINGTSFCVHRDRRYNHKALNIRLSGDTSGNLISYDADGQTTKGTSIYVSDPIWQ